MCSNIMINYNIKGFLQMHSFVRELFFVKEPFLFYLQAVPAGISQKNRNNTPEIKFDLEHIESNFFLVKR